MSTGKWIIYWAVEQTNKWSSFPVFCFSLLCPGVALPTSFSLSPRKTYGMFTLIFCNIHSNCAITADIWVTLKVIWTHLSLNLGKLPVHSNLRFQELNCRIEAERLFKDTRRHARFRSGNKSTSYGKRFNVAALLLLAESSDKNLDGLSNRADYLE